MEKIVNEKAFLISNIYDQTSSDKKVTFKFKVENSGNFQLSCDNATSIIIYDKNFNLKHQATNKLNVTLKQNEIIYVSIYTANENEKFYLNFESLDESYTTTYKLNIKNNGKDIPLYGDDFKDPLSPSLIKMSKRKGGKYIYCNVPESMPLEAVNTIIMQNKNLSGECFFTCEHSNRTGLEKIYLGYRLINNNDHDIYVTVKNVGYQVEGSWLGEKSWIDYYGIPCVMDCSNFKKEEFIYDNKKYNANDWFRDYLGFDINYKPCPIKPTTYKIPKGKYIYVIGGTSQDAYENINVNNTADKPLKLNHCANANVLFYIYNGKATGEFVAYDDVSKINDEKVVVQNMRKYGEHDDFGGRMGVSNHRGVIDDNPIWIFNDSTPSQNLPVKYYPKYADKLKETYKPLENVKNIVKHEYIGDRWFSNLSSQYHSNYIGEDMVSNKIDFNGKEITLSVYKATPAGKVWDFGNWMIEYQENCVFVNQGDKERTLRFSLFNLGSILYIFKDEQGNVLKCGTTFITCTGRTHCYEMKIKPHSRQVVSMQFVLLANNNGSIEHVVELI